MTVLAWWWSALPETVYSKNVERLFAASKNLDASGQ